MKHNKFTTINIGMFVLLLFLIAPISISAQRFGRGGMHGGVHGGGNLSRPMPPQAAQGRSNFSRPEHSRSTINGGSYSPASRIRPTTKPSPKVDHTGVNTHTTNRSTNSNARNRNRMGNDVNINIENNRNTYIHNTRNTRVVAPTRAYVRPPYLYGGRGYYSFHPYFYHPYHPFYWGPVWHPWGFFITSIATTAIIISLENQRYYYDQGVYYIQSDAGYTVVEAPVGATITELPEGTQTVAVNEVTNNYYYGGSYYEKDGEKYTVVPPTAGTIVPNLPEGGVEVKIGDQTYVQFGETYYQPVQVEGKNMYEVVQVKDE